MRKQRMKALISTAFLLTITVLSGCLGSKNSSIAPNLAFVYVVGTGDNSIHLLDQKSTGELAAATLTAFPTNPRPVGLALHPSKNFLYVPNLTSNTVSGFSLDHATGVLAPIGTGLAPTPVGTNPVSAVVNSGGQFLFVLNQGSAPPTAAAATISVFSIDTTRGLLSPVAGSPFPFASLVAPNPQFLAISPSGGVLYVSNGASGNISAFSVGSGGTLTELAGSPFAAGGTMAGITIDSKGQFLYAADSTNNKIASFSIQANGVLTSVAGSPFATDLGPGAITLDATGSFLFSANSAGADVSVFKISAGALTPVTGSPFSLVNLGNPLPSFLVVDTSNTFLYVGNQGTKNITAFTIRSDGTLVPLSTSPFGQSVGPVSMLITK